MRLTSSYNPRTNGKDERMIGTIEAGIEKKCESKGAERDTVIPHILIGYREHQDCYGLSQFEIMLGFNEQRNNEQNISTATVSS